MSELLCRRRWGFRIGKLALAPASRPALKVTLLLNAALLALFYVAWCWLDYRLVHSPQYPQNIADGDWIFALIPVLTLATNLVVYRGQGLRTALFVAVVASIVLVVLFLGVVLVFGIPFHLSIGGSL